jgi:hypothetical protein
MISLDGKTYTFDPSTPPGEWDPVPQQQPTQP